MKNSCSHFGGTSARKYMASVDEIRKKWTHLDKKKVLFCDNNAPSHTSNIAQAKKHE